LKAWLEIASGTGSGSADNPINILGEMFGGSSTSLATLETTLKSSNESMKECSARMESMAQSQEDMIRTHNLQLKIEQAQAGLDAAETDQDRKFYRDKLDQLRRELLS